MILLSDDNEAEEIAEGRISDKLLVKMISTAEKYGLRGDLYGNYIACKLILNENEYAKACEKRTGGKECSIDAFARKDAEVLLKIFGKDEEQYTPAFENTGSEDFRAGKKIMKLCEQLRNCCRQEEILKVLSGFYSENGIGIFALYRGFIIGEDGALTPVSRYSDATFEKIYGYERQKKQLKTNTEAFLDGQPANNVLLYGDSGTGKSTAVKALLSEYEKKGLRIVGVQKHQFVKLSGIISQLSKRKQKFIILLDDLSFENFETEYKYLKAIIEGGVAEKPDNILIYATSNRRHLVTETFAEREGGGDIHREETTSEKVSLSERFGLQIYYAKPDKQEYMDIVMFLAEKHFPEMDKNTLIAGANAFAVKHGGFSGRAATQYIMSLCAENNKKIELPLE